MIDYTIAEKRAQALPVTTVNVIGRMTFQWIVVGLCEETMFTGLIHTYSMKTLEGQVRLQGRTLYSGDNERFFHQDSARPRVSEPPWRRNLRPHLVI
jgi:hypothetical protein